MTSSYYELTWIRYLLHNLRIYHHIVVHHHNKATSYMAKNIVFHVRTEHIEMDCHMVRENMRDGSITTKHVSSEFQVAYICTKPLGSKLLLACIYEMGAPYCRKC